VKTKPLLLPRSDLAAYAAAMWSPFQLARHHKLVVEKLEAVERGDIDRLMIFLPPRHGKSLAASTLFPAWYLGRHPDRSIIACSYGQELASDFGRRVRGYVTDQLHTTIFPDSRVVDDSNAVHRFGLTRGGNYYAVGAGGPITGRGADLLLIDDPIKSREDANSAAFRRGLQSWYESVAYTRLQPGGAIVLIQTRWHQDDLAGWLLREHASEGWDVVSLPAIAETGDALGREEGAPLWPEQFPLEVLERIREAIGTSAWLSLYAQRPVAEEGAIFKRGWFKTFSTEPELKRIVFSLDTAFKTGKQNDYSVIAVFGEAKDGYFLLHVTRERLEFPDLKRRVVSLSDIMRPHAVLVEDAASGQSLIQALKSETRLPILPVKPMGDKVSRANAVSPLVESGRVYLRDQAAWLNDFLEELTSFPAAPHDDQTDAFCQALSYLRGNHIWRSSDGGYVSVQRSVWAPSRRPMSVAEQDRLDDSQADIDRMRRRSGWASRWGLRGHCW
jgi:predicted phage terminase large subunit-like protein